jgi:hypothetical protein
MLSSFLIFSIVQFGFVLLLVIQCFVTLLSDHDFVENIIPLIIVVFC